MEEFARRENEWKSLLDVSGILRESKQGINLLYSLILGCSFNLLIVSHSELSIYRFLFLRK